MGGLVRHVARLGLGITLALTAVGLADVPAAQAASPVVLAFLPVSGPVGTSVTITGLGFQDSSPATGVAFNGTAASFSVDSTTQITATVPTGATTGPISVTDSEGTGATLLSFTVTPSPPPTILSFLPLSGPVGTSVTILGTGFQDSGPVTDVAFDGTAASFSVDSPTQITATVPTGATTGPISVTDSAGTGASLLDFTVTSSPTPTILSFLPLSGPVGTPVTITGTGFTGASSVAFAGEPATFDVISDLQIDTVVPAHASTGPISVTTPGGVATSLLDFTVPVSHRRSVGLWLRKHLRAIGRVATHDGFGACESNASVKIQRRRHGSWRTVKHDVTNARGRYRVAMKDRRGTYRTIVRRTEVNGGQHVCRRAVSRIRRRP